MFASRQGWVAAVLLGAILALGSCGGTSSGGGPDGGDAGPVTACTGTNGMRRPNGQACGCAGDCQSGFCIDGVCCNSSCGDACKSCNTPQSPGTCSFVPSGLPPRSPSVCPKSEASTCGLDGTCNGAGACRKYASGTVCKAGTCDGASVGNVNVCDGAGRCKPGPATVCAPFDCDTKTNKCFSTCASDGDCTGGVKCVKGSCGPKPRGAVCAANADCASGFCADGVCCNVACKGACITCNQVGREGTCWPIDPGVPDPRQVCKDQHAASCGQTGACDGFGGCSLYAPETICTPPTCSGDRVNTAGTCNGLGLCRAPGVQNCPPYRCVDGACTTKCVTDADCQAGHACDKGSCGQRQNGQACTKAGDCQSNFCVDGVCCADACQGACKSCALPSSMGRCAPAPAGAGDPHGVCADQGAASCGTDGACDGAGGCRKYRAGTTCAPEKCEGNVFTPAAACSSAGQCVAPASLACAPYACNGARCFTACTNNSACLAPNTCDAQGSCGKKTNGSFCSDPTECGSGVCAQGVCCAGACSGSCQSCALATSMGLCRDVPAGAPDPASICAVQPVSTCGTNGMCEAGACQKYVQGAPCADATCPPAGTSYTPGASCDGAGRCVTPPATSCFPFRCGAQVCKATCAADADCATPAVCTNGSCGLKSPGATCADGAECASGFCAQGVCCRTACTGTCLSCALVSAPGTCTPVASGDPDPTGTCQNAGPATCDTTGFCDGKGSCELFPAGTSCAAPTCPANGTTQTLGRTCDGAGMCKPAGTQSCAPYTCNGMSCNTTCQSDNDCAAPNICDLTTNKCGDKKRLGEPCGGTGECLTGNSCVDGVCCATASCGTCQACNVQGLEGTCSEVPADASEPHGRCTPSPPCGFDGTCDGKGACKNAPAATSCGTASCTGSTLKPVGFCNGAGSCTQTTSSCGNYMCASALACLTTCAGDNDCAAGFTCQGTSCTDLFGNGHACTGDTECVSGHCVENVCCGSASCPICTSCAVQGAAGSCAAVPAGGMDPKALCLPMAASTCGTDGTCDGKGACALFAKDTVCMAGSCPAGSSSLSTDAKCDGMGTCNPGTLTSCAPYACGADNACKKEPCAGDGDCASGSTCDLGSQTCQ